MAFQYNETLPDARFPSYEPSAIITFTIEKLDAQALMVGSLAITGDIDPVEIRLPPHVGVHCFFESIQSTGASFGTLENIQAYNTTIGTKSSIQKPDATSAYYNMQHIVPNYTQGAQLRAQRAGATSMPFVCIPQIALNRGSGAIPFEKTGAIRITLTLASQNNSAMTTTAWSLKNLKLRYITTRLNVLGMGAEQAMQPGS